MKKVIKISNSNATQLAILATCTRDMIHESVQKIMETIQLLLLTELLEKTGLQGDGDKITITLDYGEYLSSYNFSVPPYNSYSIKHILYNLTRGTITQYIEKDLLYSALSQ